MIDESPATKADVAALRSATKADINTAITALGAELRAEFATKTELKAEIASLRTELTTGFDDVRQEIRHQGVLFEQLGSKVDALGEGLLAFREHYTAEIRALREELSARIALLEDVVRQHSTDIRAIRADVRTIQADVADLRRRFDRLEREADLEKRVTEVEKRLGIR